jgi:pimeloyl-ACP methyl ester carboxylesterase
MKHLIFIIIALTSAQLAATDLAKEKRWADQVVDSLMDGDALWLNDGRANFLSLYTEAAKDKQRAVIIMHGTGIHPDWQQVIQPLRVELPAANWHTLSIQMPILANEAQYSDYAPLYDEVAPRIEAALSYLQRKGVKKIVLLGHSQGAAMAAYYLRGNNSKVTGFFSIGMPGGFGDDRQNTLKSLKAIKIPVLDLYGSDDLESVLSTAGKRAQAGKHTTYQQKKVSGADHFFEGKEDELVAAVSNWLESYDTPALK